MFIFYSCTERLKNTEGQHSVNNGVSRTTITKMLRLLQSEDGSFLLDSDIHGRRAISLESEPGPDFIGIRTRSGAVRLGIPGSPRNCMSRLCPQLPSLKYLLCHRLNLGDIRHGDSEFKGACIQKFHKTLIPSK